MTHSKHNIPEYLAGAMELHMVAALVMNESRRGFSQFLNEHGEGISGLQYGILRLLQRETLTSSEISKHMMLDPSTLVPSVNGLERRGFIERRRDTEDRRRMPLSLTDKAHTLLNRLPEIGEDHAVVAALKQMDPDERRQLLHFVRKFAALLPEGEDTLCRLDERIREHTIAKQTASALENPLDSNAT